MRALRWEHLSENTQVELKWEHSNGNARMRTDMCVSNNEARMYEQRAYNLDLYSSKIANNIQNWNTGVVLHKRSWAIRLPSSLFYLHTFSARGSTFTVYQRPKQGHCTKSIKKLHFNRIAFLNEIQLLMLYCTPRVVGILGWQRTWLRGRFRPFRCNKVNAINQKSKF